MVRSFDETIETGKKLATVKSPSEFAQAQAKYAQESLSLMAEESKKFTELAASLAKDASGPFTEIYRVAITPAAKEKKSQKLIKNARGQGLPNATPKLEQAENSAWIAIPDLLAGAWEVLWGEMVVCSLEESNLHPGTTR